MIRQDIENYEHILLSPKATFSDCSIGRKYQEEEDDLRTCFMRDRDRIIHSKAFRRLNQKTQVYITPGSDHYRTRLTHTLEVNQIAKTIGKALRLNEDLIEAIALAHDLGHTPFAHTGERVLNSLMPEGFQHNKNSVRVVERIETHNGKPGLNLSAEVLDGIVFHSGYGKDGPCANTLEGQIIRFSDKIAYVQHDIDDSIRAGIITEDDLPKEYTDILGHRHGERITVLVKDLITTSRKKIVESNSDEKIVLGFSKRIDEALKGLREYMFIHVYQSSICYMERERAELVIRFLFDYYCKHVEALPQLYRDIVDSEGIEIGVCDYLSGMSDNFCISAFQKLTIPRSFIE